LEESTKKVNAPVQINVQDMQQLVPPFFMPITADRVEEIGNDDIAPDDGVGRPFGAQDGTFLGLDEPLTR
jgi:hypothetical protein